MVGSEFELGLDLDSAGELIPEIFLILLGGTKRLHHCALLPTAKGDNI